MLPDDLKVVEALRAGNENMFELLFRQYYNSLCNYANSIVKDVDEAEDMVQQVMITIWEKRNTLQITTSLKSYLFRAVHNASLNSIRKQKTITSYTESNMQSQEMSEMATSGNVMTKELNSQIGIAIEKLPQQCRMVFKLSRFENMKYAEIAVHLEISVKTVENHMGKALKLLRMELKDFLIWILFVIQIWNN